MFKIDFGIYEVYKMYLFNEWKSKEGVVRGMIEWDLFELIKGLF